MNSVKPKSLVLGAILALAALFLAFLPGIMGVSKLLVSYIVRNVFYCIALPAAMCYATKFHSAQTRTVTIFSGLISALFSQFIVIGQSFYLSNSFNIYGSMPLSLAAWLCQSVVWFYILHPLVALAAQWFRNFQLKAIRRHLNYRKLFISTVLIRLGCLLLFYPGIFDFDAALSLRTMLQRWIVLDNHNPYFIQFIHAAFYRFGLNCFGRPDIGILLLTMVWILISSAIIVYTTQVLEKASNARVAGITGYFMAFFPIFPVLSLYITKDGFFSYSFLLYIATLLNLYNSYGNCLKSFRFSLLFCLAITLVCFTRNQGIFVIVIESFLLLWFYRKKFILLLSVCAVPVMLFLWVNAYYFPAMRIAPASKGEAYGMMFQHTARYLKTYPEDVTPTEYEAVNNVLSAERLAQLYNPRINDPVKGTYRYGSYQIALVYSDTLADATSQFFENEKKALSDYRRAWLSMLVKHPGPALNAQFAIMQPFFYNCAVDLFSFYPYWEDTNATFPEYSFYHFVKPADYLSYAFHYLAAMPLTDIIFGICSYIWCAIFLVGLLFWRCDQPGIVVFFPVILSLLFLCVCPVASARYTYPIVVALPLLFAYALTHNHRSLPK